MRKKIIALALASTVMLSTSVSALATRQFDMSVFDGRQDISMSSDDMAGLTYISLTGDTYYSVISFDNGTILTITPSIYLTDTQDYYYLNFDCFESVPTGMSSIIIKIGDNRYTFSGCGTNRSSLGDGTLYERISFPMKRETVNFMTDFENHRNDEIRVRINGTYQTLDFSLTDEMKNEILALYDLYVSGNGTRDSNLRSITNTDPVIVSKNGKVIDGHVKEEVIDALFQSMR